MTVFEVGKTYRLECVTLPIGKRNEYFHFPILHSHVGDVSGDLHYHLNLQFVPDSILKQIKMKRDEILAMGEGYPIAEHDVTCCSEEVSLKRYSEKGFNDLIHIQKNCSRLKLDLNTMLCPHQGCSLANSKAEIQEGKLAFVCPCHGLAWDATDGSLIPRNLVTSGSIHYGILK